VVRYVILLGIAKEDVPTDADLLAEKIAGLCLFECMKRWASFVL
jgi:D-Tyr-tRNAtyr deacylase